MADVTGTIKLIGQVEIVGQKNTKKRLCVVTFQDGNYSNDLAVEFLKEKADVLDNYRASQEVKISYNVSSREWNSKWFTQCVGWRIALADGAQPANQPVAAGQSAQQPYIVPNQNDEPLPF